MVLQENDSMCCSRRTETGDYFLVKLAKPVALHLKIVQLYALTF